MVEDRAWRAKRAADETIKKALIADLDRLWDRVKGWSPDAIEEALVKVLPSVVDKYGAAYAEVAAQWFHALTGETPVLGDARKAAQVQASVRWALRPLFKTGAVTVAQDRLAGSMVRQAQQAGRDTLDRSVRATPGVLYARRLRGPSNCDFCVVLASRGPVYGSAREAGAPGNRYHDLCDCEPVPVRGRWIPDGSSPRGVRWVGEDPGYDFETLYLNEYRPYWREGLTINEIIGRRVDARAAAPWGGVTWLEDLQDSKAKPPLWWNEAARQKTLIGHPSRKPGRWNGGHGYGRNVPGKTELPERWTDEDIDLILAETWTNPTAVRYAGDCRYTRRVIDGVLVEVSAYGTGYTNYRAYFAVGGRGVLYNDKSGNRTQKRIPKISDDWEVP